MFTASYENYYRKPGVDDDDQEREPALSASGRTGSRPPTIGKEATEVAQLRKVKFPSLLAACTRNFPSNYLWFFQAAQYGRTLTVLFVPDPEVSIAAPFILFSA